MSRAPAPCPYVTGDSARASRSAHVALFVALGVHGGVDAVKGMQEDSGSIDEDSEASGE